MKRQIQRNKYYRIELTALFFFGVIFFSAFACAADVQSGSSFEYDTARPGSSYKNFELYQDSPALCQETCIENTQCMAWTYVKPKRQGSPARCWLKNDVPDAKSNACCISGIKISLALEVVAQKAQQQAIVGEGIITSLRGFGLAGTRGPAGPRGLDGYLPELHSQQERFPTEHVWKYIDKLGDEPGNYAAYSYVLSGRDGSDKYAELVKSIQASTSEADGVVKHISPQELNLFLIPINEKGSAHEPDYQTSKALLTVLGVKSSLSFDRPGPYIITLVRPISMPQGKIVDILYVDLTNVHKGAVPELVRTYKQTVLKENIDGLEKLSSLRLSLLNLAFLAEDSIGFAKTASASLKTVFQ